MYVRNPYEEHALIEMVVLVLCGLGAMAFVYFHPYLALQLLLGAMGVVSGGLLLLSVFFEVRNRLRR